MVFLAYTYIECNEDEDGAIFATLIGGRGGGIWLRKAMDQDIADYVLGKYDLHPLFNVVYDGGYSSHEHKLPQGDIFGDGDTLYFRPARVEIF